MSEIINIPAEKTVHKKLISEINNYVNENLNEKVKS